MSQELDAIRKGLDMQIKEAIEREDVPQHYVQQVTQSYLLLQVLTELQSINSNLDTIWTAIDRLDPNG